MALGRPVQEVIEVFGAAPLGQQDLVSALQRCGFSFNCLTFGSLIATGWYFLAVPSLNNVGGMHEVIVHYNADFGCSGFRVLDPSNQKTYDIDGKNLVTWSSPILFIPGGRLP